MLLSKQDLTSQGYLDMDAISDITGLSMDNINNDECGSQHSGSIGSDNTDILLKQNISLSELDGDDSLLESVSQVGEQDVYIQQSFPVTSKQNTSTDDNSFLSGYGRQTNNISSEFVSQSKHMENKYYSLPDLNKQAVQKTVPNHEETRQSHSVEKYGFVPEGKRSKANEQSLSKFSMRKFPSDPNMLGSGRQSVIKHHSSLPSVNLEVSSISTSSNSSGDLIERQAQKHSILVENQGNKHTKKNQQVWFHPATFPNDKDEFDDDFMTPNTRGRQTIVDTSGLPRKPKKLKDVHFGSEENREMLSQDQNGKLIGPGDHIGYREEMNPDNKERSEFEPEIVQDSLGEYNGNRGTREMLLGVKHDPDTNELYDDKVREGADLLSRILGDPNGSFTSFSSISRSSEKSDQSKPLHENKSQTTNQRSLDSSLNSEPKTKLTSSPRHYDQHISPSNSQGNTREPKLNTETLLRTNSQGLSESYDTRQRNQWTEEQPGINGEQMDHEGTIETRVYERQVPETSTGYLKNDYDFSNEDRATRQTLETGPGTESSFNEVSDVEDHLENKIEELRILELDIDEIHCRKKMAVQELNALEHSLHRNKADMSSSESLVEQYRWQATQTRSELMELEKTRNQLQEDCNSLNEMLKKSKRNETFNSDDIMFGRSKEEIFTCLQERDRFERELGATQETLKREKERAKRLQDDLRGKVRTLEEDLKKEQDDAMKNLREVKEQMNKERQKVRTVQHDKLNAINNLHDEMKQLQDKGIEALKAQIRRERASTTELLEEKFKREANHLKMTAETAESRIKQLEATLVERNDEISKLRGLVREEKQKNLDVEKQWRAQLESERQDGEIRADEQERSFKDREEKFVRKQSDLENLLEERTADLRRSEERCRSQTEELQKIIENKNEEVKLVRGLVRQQEDATRVLGERLRTEAREHVRKAVEKERECLSKEKERIGRTVDDEKEKRTRIVKQLSEQLEMEKESHLQTKQTMNKLKHEADDLRKQVVEVHGERITSVQRVRQEGSEELGKIKDKLHEFTVQADKLERTDKEIAHAIYEECRKMTELVGMATPLKTPTRLPDEKTDKKATEAHESPTKEALASLRRCNDELRQRLNEMKKQMDNQKTESGQIKKNTPFRDSEEVTKLKKLVQEREGEIQQLHRKYGDEIKHLQEERKKDQMTYRRTVTKLEQEFHKLIPTNVSAGSSRVVKRDITTRNTVSSSDDGLNRVPSHFPPKIPSSSGETSTSTDLLKHLQDRVKKLRAENENLKKSSDKEPSFNSTKHSGRIKSFSNSDSVLSQSKSLSISQLHSSTKNSDIKTRHHSKLSSDNIEQVTRLQRLLNSTTKEDSKSSPTNTG